jgi:hypothetical protein
MQPGCEIAPCGGSKADDDNCTACCEFCNFNLGDRLSFFNITQKTWEPFGAYRDHFFVEEWGLANCVTVDVPPQTSREIVLIDNFHAFHF